MEFANRGNRPNQPVSQQPAQQPGQQPMQQPAFQVPSNNKKKKIGFDMSKIGMMIMSIAGILLIIALTVSLAFAGNNNTGNAEADVIMTDRYQAVFLDSQDGQVYFGKLEIYNGNLYKLTDIFYVRVENPIQPEAANQAAQPNISLAKLGNELHGPEDVMYIDRDQVLYWENLKTDGQVAKAIADFVTNGRQTPAANQPQTSTPAPTAQENANEEETETPTPTPTPSSTPTPTPAP